jgi:hypothetical protein
LWRGWTAVFSAGQLSQWPRCLAGVLEQVENLFHQVFPRLIGPKVGTAHHESGFGFLCKEIKIINELHWEVVSWHNPWWHRCPHLCSKQVENLFHQKKLYYKKFSLVQAPARSFLSRCCTALTRRGQEMVASQRTSA